MAEFNALKNTVNTIDGQYVRVSTKRLPDLTITSSSRYVTVTTVAVCNNMQAVWLELCGVANSYDHHLVLNSWSWSNNTLTLNFWGDADKYYPTIAMLWR